MKTTIRYTARCILAILLIGFLWFGFNEIINPGYTYNFWYTVDVLANVTFHGDHETISSRLGKAQLNDNMLATGVCFILDDLFNEKDHCIKSIE